MTSMSGSAPRVALPRLCMVGPLMAERHGGFVVTQGVALSNRFRMAGYTVVTASSSPNRYVRLLDIASTIIRERRGIDILIIHVYGGPSFVVEDVASWLGRRFGHRVVMLLHGGSLPEFMSAFPRWAHRVLRRADAIVAPSPYLARAVEARGFACLVIPNVIDLSQYPYRHRRQLEPRLFWMRSFHPAYNPIMAVQVVDRLRVTHPRASLVMGGQDKGMLAQVKALARRLGLEDAVRFPGFLDMAAKMREGAAADIFINTNRIDNMPVALVESAAMGLPIVSTAVGGIADLVADGETALLCPGGDVEGMVEAIRRLLGDSELAGRLSENGRRLAERSAWRQVYPQWEALFSQLLRAPLRGAGRDPGVRN